MPRTAPDEAAEERGQQPGRLVTEHLDDVRVRLEELVRCVVVLAAVRPEGWAVADNDRGGLERPAPDGPEERRDALRADLDL